MAAGENSAEVKNYIRDKIRAGKFLIKSLHQRQQTILNIAREIVKRQHEFMDKGVAQLKPMTMAQIAVVVGVHETTVSRAVSGKYMQTPQGIFEMRFFFTGGLQTAAGTDVSNASVKDMIAEIYKQEDPPGRCPTRRSWPCSRPKASPSRAAPSPNTATNSTSCPRICARFIKIFSATIPILPSSPFAARSVLLADFFLRLFAHPVNEQNAVQMIHLMLDGARQQPARAKFNRLQFFVQRLHVHKAGPGNFRENFREAQAAFAGGDRFANRLDFRIDEDERHDFVHVGGLALEFERGRAFGDFAHVNDGELQRPADLLRGQADAVPFVHGFEHVGDEPFDFRRDFFNRARLFAGEPDGRI
jgi:hypothetical protein